MKLVLAIACALLTVAACGEDSVDFEPVTTTVRPAAVAAAPPLPATSTTIDPPTTTTTDVPSETTVGSIDSATGVVVEVDGDLSAIDRFSVLLADGSTLSFTPEPGLLFDHDGPLSHLRDHLVSGSPVLVEFYQHGELLIAAAVGDAE